MAWQFPISSSIPGIAVPLGTTDSVFVAQGVLVASTGSVAITGTGSNHQIIVAGTAVSASLQGATVQVGGGVQHDINIAVEATGDVRSYANYAVAVIGSHNHVSNAGFIFGTLGGLFISAYGNNPFGTALFNSGTIGTPGTGIARITGSTETISLTNSGTLSGGIAYGNYGGDTVARDVIINSGRISGTIDFGSGNDSYTGTTGHLFGHLLGGAGIDIATGGIDNDWFEGGTEADTLTGNGGSDRLIGDAGNDKLFGGLGNDLLIGGRGGANSDIFVFNTTPNTLTNRDVITDFDHVEDTIQLENAIFTRLTVGGVLNPALFWNGTTAHDANDFIVYNRASGALYYDPNGNLPGGSIMFAVLQNKPAIAANDFVVI